MKDTTKVKDTTQQVPACGWLTLRVTVEQQDTVCVAITLHALVERVSAVMVEVVLQHQHGSSTLPQLDTVDTPTATAVVSV